MTKPMVERYEQILSQDPTSTVFVELAKALIERGEHQRAIEVCKGGLSHHKGSVVGRVLWGKALINLGRPAEAMEQFDQAIGIDKENPHAYNLIGEVLLHKGLYRSALPLLKRAVALQPNDGRVRQWLEQTHRALAGGPAPVLADHTSVDGDPSALMTDPGAREEAPLSDPHASPTLVDIPAFVPSSEAAPEGGSEAPREWPHDKPPPPVPDDPFEQAPKRTSSSETLRGMTDTFDALASAASAAAAHEPRPPGANGEQDAPAQSPAQPETVPGLTSTYDVLQKEPISEPTVIPSDELYMDGNIERSGKRKRGRAEDSGPTELTSGDLEVPAPPPKPPPRPTGASGAKKGLLDDVPDMVEPPSSLEVPKVELSSTATEAIAKEYERELRQKLEAAAARKSFLQRHGAKLAVAVVSLVALGVGAAFYVAADRKQKQLEAALTTSIKRVAEDTAESYRAALDSLQSAVQLREGSARAWALAAYAHAVLYAEHGGDIEHQAQGLAALQRPGVSEDYPGLALAAEYYLTEPKEREAAAKTVLASSIDEPEVRELAGRILLSQKKTSDGIKQLSRAVELNAAHVRALVALGSYYLQFGDYEQALRMYTGAAATISKLHPERVIGAAEARLELSRALETALEEVRALPAAEAIPVELRYRRELALGRLLSVNGRHDEALKVLSDGQKSHKGRAYEFAMALGQAHSRSGDMKSAEDAFEAALKARPQSEDAREGLGLALIARDREKEALSRIQGDGKKVALVRGIAYSRLGDHKRARQELARTQSGGKFPPEAVAHLALADVAEGQAERAQKALEKALTASKRAKSDVRVALGNIYWQQGALDRAKMQFEEAAKDSTEYEGACSLGRLLAQLGLHEQAVEPLEKAVFRNRSHGEARHSLAGAYFALGRLDDALLQAEAWQADNPSAALAQKDLAHALYRVGRFKEAEAAAAKAVKLSAEDGEAHRIRAMALFARGDGRQGFSSLERANKLDPKDSDTFCEIGLAFLRVGNEEMAEKAYEAALREDPKSACGLAGQHHARLPRAAKGSAKELSALAQKAVWSWDRAFAGATMARVLLAQGSPKEARKVAEAAVALAPASGVARLSLGLVAARQKDEAACREALEKAAELEPAHSAVHLALGDQLARGGEEDQEPAVREYETFLRLGGSDADMARVKKALQNLKKKLEQR
ncbi:MAG: tetratricopeptide repeat protein [Myxococcales bacterium]|nr:tetratricopeptide repeat protein [Myxococcales bacterium]